MYRTNTLLICLLIIFASTSLSAQNDPPSKNSYEQLKKAIETGEVVMSFNQASTRRGATVSLESSGNSLILTPQTSTGDLPYFGATQVLTSDFGSGNIEFDGTTERRRVKYNDKKQQVQISYSVKGKSDSYSCSLTLFAGGSSNLSVSSVSRDRISYRGNYEIR